MKAGILIAAGVLITASFPSSAHHSAPAHYFMDQSISVEGVVTEFLWRNPHSFLHIEVDDGGELKIWALELHNTIAMARFGYSPDMFQTGDAVVASGAPSRDGNRRMQTHSVRRLSDGFEYTDPTLAFR